MSAMIVSRPEKKARSECADLSSVKAYYNNPEEEGIDGWYYSGDIGRFDPDGYLYVVGRMKDLIETGGNVAPKEIEEIPLLYPDVVDAAVFGEPDPEWGEAIKAYVVLREEKRLDEIV
jgi:acyl-CoA synthetase (AMP-forming)/AMP-acid ligase II